MTASPQDSSQYSGCSQQGRSLNGLPSSSYFKVLQSLYQSFADCTACANYKWYHRHFQLPVFVISLARSWHFSLSFSFTRWSAGPAKSTIWQVLLFFANGPGDGCSIPGRIIPKIQKMVLDVTLHCIQYYKMRIKGKKEQSWE